MNILLIKSWYSKNKIHLIIWTIFIIYEVFIIGIASKFDTFKNYVIHYTVNILVFYFHAFGLKKTLSKKTWLVVPFIILEIVLFMFIAALSEVIFSDFKGTVSEALENKMYVARTLWRMLYFIGFSTAYVYLLNFLEVRKRAEELERQNLVTTIEKQALENDLVQSQNNYLRSQINPHFLFNTLNFIYNDARKKAPIAADAIMNLAEMMRYALKRPEVSDMVPLSEEIEQIEHLINLHKLRTAGIINLELKVEGDLFGIRFPPLILLTLVENMFKHGNVSHSSQLALIHIKYEDHILTISTINMINNIKAKESTNVGVDNVRKRLSNFYNNAYTFTYEKDPLNRFITEIKVRVSNPMQGLNTI